MAAAPPRRPTQAEIDAATMRIENPTQIIGSGYIKFPPQRPFEKPLIAQPPTIVNLPDYGYEQTPNAAQIQAQLQQQQQQQQQEEQQLRQPPAAYPPANAYPPAQQPRPQPTYHAPPHAVGGPAHPAGPQGHYGMRAPGQPYGAPAPGMPQRPTQASQQYQQNPGQRPQTATSAPGYNQAHGQPAWMQSRTQPPQQQRQVPPVQNTAPPASAIYAQQQNAARPASAKPRPGQLVPPTSIQAAPAPQPIPQHAPQPVRGPASVPQPAPGGEKLSKSQAKRNRKKLREAGS